MIEIKVVLLLPKALLFALYDTAYFINIME